MIGKIATVAVYVENQEIAEEFWVQQVGFVTKEKRKMGPQDYWLEVGPAQGQTHLVLYPKTMIQDASEHKASIVFQCENVEQAYLQMKEKGVEFLGEPQKMQWGTFVQFRDNEGNSYLLKN